MENATCDKIPGRFGLVFYLFLAAAISLFTFYSYTVGI